MTHRVGDALIRAFGDRIAAELGMRFGNNRRDDLQRAVRALAVLAGFDDEKRALEQWLIRPWSSGDVQTLAGLLSVGETYFFRDAAAFDVLEHELLPPLVVARRAGTRRLRAWSAGCSTGEEAYSLAIMLSRLVPDHADWGISILATDIHPGCLTRAQEGVYGEWSFRGVPELVREQYFERMEGERFRVKDVHRTMVHFQHGNLMDPATFSEGFDLILCRNVLMYFGQEQARQVVRHLRASLADNGLLLVAPTEAGGRCFEGFEALRFQQSVVHRKVSRVHRPAPERQTAPAGAHGASVEQALARCEAAIGRDKCDAALHVQHAALLEEAQQPERAREALRRALFLDPDMALARNALKRLSQAVSARPGRRRHRETAS